MNICLLGNANHGKDTVAEMISDNTGMSFESSSLTAAKIFIYDELKETHNYSSLEECHKDRVNHRALWHNMICDYNKDDKARLAKEILARNDMYNGMRSNVEFQECQKLGLFDYVIGIFDPKKPLEPSDSFDIDLFESCDFVIITGDLEKVEKNVKEFCKIFDHKRYTIPTTGLSDDEAEEKIRIIKDYRDTDYVWDNNGEVSIDDNTNIPYSKDIWIGGSVGGTPIIEEINSPENE